MFAKKKVRSPDIKTFLFFSFFLPWNFYYRNNMQKTGLSNCRKRPIFSEFFVVFACVSSESRLLEVYEVETIE